MQFPEPWAFVFCVAAALVPLSAAAGHINARAWVSEPLLCTALGVVVGPLGLGLLHLDVGSSPEATMVMREGARVTLAIAVTGAAMRLPHGWLRQNWLGMAVALGPGMLAMWGMGALFTGIVIGLAPLQCLLIGAAIAPTDPILAAPIVSGELAQKNIPTSLRNGITAESGANDGVALLWIMLPLLLLDHGLGDALSRWAVDIVLREIALAIIVGALTGWLTKQCLEWFWRFYGKEDAPPSLLSAILALSLATLAICRVLGADGLLGAFVAGAVVNEGVHDDAEERQHLFNEAIGRFFDLPILVLFGVALPWSDWIKLGWPALAFVGAILLLRRIPAWLALHWFMPWTHRLPEALFAGWFGPIGVGALFYATDVHERAGVSALWPLVSLAVAASVVAHGISGTPLTDWLGRLYDSGPVQSSDGEEHASSRRSGGRAGAA